MTLMPPRDSSPGTGLPPDACTPGPAGMSGETIHDAVAELLRAFPRWAVWVPSEHSEWTALRPASARPPSAGLPMIWAHAATAAELARKMRAIDEQLSPPREQR